MKSEILSVKHIKLELKRNIWVMAVISFAFLIFLPVAEIMWFENTKSTVYTIVDITENYMANYMNYLQSGGIFLVTVLASLMGGITGFSWLHSRKKVDFYHSLPVRRESSYLQHLIVNLIYYAVPFAVCIFLCICIGAGHGIFSGEIVGMYLANFICGIVFYLLLYSATALAFILTGKILVGILGTGAFFTYGILIWLLYRGMCYTFFSTYSINVEGSGKGIGWKVAELFAPLAYFMDSTRGAVDFTRVAIGFLEAAVFFALGWFAYKKRKSEAAGQAMAFGPVKRIVRYLVVIPGGMAAGLFAANMGVAEHRRIWFVCGTVVGTVLVHGLMEIIYEMDFRRFLAHKKQLVFAGAAIAVLSAVFICDLVKYDEYFPEQSQLKEIKFSVYTGTGNIISIQKNSETGLMECDYDAYGAAGNTKEVYEFLREAVKEDIDLSEYSSQEINQMELYTWNVGYVKKNGKTVYRQYTIPSQLIYDNYEKMCDTEQFRRYLYYQLEEKMPYLSEIRTLGISTQGKTFNDSKELNEKIVRALIKDIEEADGAEFLEEPIGGLECIFELETSDKTYYMSSWSETFLIYPGFENTREVLNAADMRIENTLNPDDIAKITVTNYNNADENDQAEITVCEDKEEIRQIVGVLQNPQLTNLYTQSEAGYSVEIVFNRSDIENGLGYYSIQRGKVPEFLQ